MHYAKRTYYSRIRRDSVCNTFQEPIITSVIDVKKITAWGELGFPARFLGSGDPPVLVECKSHTWTGGGNVPGAKLTSWNEAMLYFLVAPDCYRKVLFVLRDFSERRNETLAEYYVRTYAHVIPDDVEVLEYDGHEPTNRLR